MATNLQAPPTVFSHDESVHQSSTSSETLTNSSNHRHQYCSFASCKTKISIFHKKNVFSNLNKKFPSMKLNRTVNKNPILINFLQMEKSEKRNPEKIESDHPFKSLKRICIMRAVSVLVISSIILLNPNEASAFSFFGESKMEKDPIEPFTIYGSVL
jgi:hypothetical protein